MTDTLRSLLEHLGFPIHVEVVNYRTSDIKEVKELLSNPHTIIELQEYLRKNLNGEYKIPADFNFAFVNILSWDYKERINGILSVTFLIQVLLKKQKELPNLNFNLTKWVQFFFIGQVELLQELKQVSCNTLVVNKDVHLPEDSSNNTEVIYREEFVFPIIANDNKSNSERCDVCVDIKMRIPSNITIESLKEKFSLPFILMCDKVVREFWETLISDLSKAKNQES